MGALENIIRKFKSYIRVFGALALTWAVLTVIPVSDPPWYAVLGLLLVCYIIVMSTLEALIALLAGIVGETVGPNGTDNHEHSASEPNEVAEEGERDRERV